MKTLSALVETLRPRQWTKNLFLFAGILFSQNLFDGDMLVRVAAAFAIFCVLSGAVYIFNDISDIEQDRRHPAKSKRPLPSGRLSARTASSFFIIAVLGSLAASYFLGFPFLIAALAYFILQIAYTLFLKKVVILDVFAIAAGFVIRVVAGALVIDVAISSWLIICTILLSLFLGLNKRRHELQVLEDSAHGHREVLKDYSPYLLDQMIAVVTASTVVCYALYTMWPETIDKFGTPNLIFTVPFVLYGIFRYLFLVHKKGEGGNPENILVTDIPLMINIFLWAVTAGIILYL